MTSWSDSQGSSAAAAAGSSLLGSSILALALPFAAHQTDHLTGGGFDVPGSQSQAVSESLQNDFSTKTGGIAVLLASRSQVPARAARAAAIDRVRRAVAKLDEVTLPPATAQAG